MTSWRRTHGGHYTETHRVVGDQVKVVSCCCAAPAWSRKACALTQGNKTPCRCFCHSTETEEQARARMKEQGK